MSHSGLSRVCTPSQGHTGDPSCSSTDCQHLPQSPGKWTKPANALLLFLLTFFPQSYSLSSVFSADYLYAIGVRKTRSRTQYWAMRSRGTGDLTPLITVSTCSHSTWPLVCLCQSQDSCGCFHVSLGQWFSILVAKDSHMGKCLKTLTWTPAQSNLIRISWWEWGLRQQFISKASQMRTLLGNHCSGLTVARW